MLTSRCILTCWKAEKEAVTLWESVQVCGSNSIWEALPDSHKGTDPIYGGSTLNLI